MLSPSLYLGAPSTTAGQSQWTGVAMDTEGAGQAPKASEVTTGASSPMTDQDPAQAGFHKGTGFSKSEVSRLADRGAALGLGMRFPNNSLWGRVWI